MAEVMLPSKTPGDTALRPDSATTASVKYKGTCKKMVRCSIPTPQRACRIVAGNHRRSNIIPIWGEALPYWEGVVSSQNTGSAYLGYGPNGSPPDIPGNANIIFDIQVVDVK